MGTSKTVIQKETAEEAKRHLNAKPQVACPTYRDGYKSSVTGVTSTRKRNMAQKVDDYWMGSATKKPSYDTHTSDDELDSA